MDRGSEPRPRRTVSGRSRVDAAIYAASTVFAGVAWALADPLQRSWGRLAVWPYAIGALIAWTLLPLDPRRRRILAVAVMTGATLLPVLWGVSRRSGDDPGASARSEVFIVEEATTALLGGRNPYEAEFHTGPLASRPMPTRTHVPYPPAMLAFGLPAAIAGPGPLTDARVWFLVVSIVVTVAALRMMRSDDEGRLRSFQVLFVLPTGSMVLATGGHDIPVLAALLAAFVLTDRGRTDTAGVVSGIALAMRQTSILVIPFIVAAVPPGRRARFVGMASIPVLALVVPFLAWDPRAFVEDVVLFPLGLGDGRSSAQTPTVGSALLGLLPEARTPLTILLVLTIVASVLLLLRTGRSATVDGAGARAAGAFAIAIALAPAGRFGYVVYPISLAVWAYAFARVDRRGGDDRDATTAPATATRSETATG
ncbi:MAG TPA: glycosyltransferase 87 family protein [Actinomycetota bacterium]|nr:glycosyltransferase 87 family protein [Actinomycetota bacterium]